MSRNPQPRKSGQVSKALRERRSFWHKIAAAMADGVISVDEVVGR